MGIKRKRLNNSHRMTQISMQNLPNEILWNIFRFVGRDNWLSALLTCRNWKSIGTYVFDPSIEQNRAIRVASRKGKLESVKFLLKDHRVNPSTHRNLPIRHAAAYGHHKIVRELLKDSRVDPSAFGNQALMLAIRNRYPKVVKLLIQDIKVTSCTMDYEALFVASAKGHLGVLKVLLENNKIPKEVVPRLLKAATTHGHPRVVQLLHKDSERIMDG